MSTTAKEVPVPLMLCAWTGSTTSRVPARLASSVTLTTCTVPARVSKTYLLSPLTIGNTVHLLILIPLNPDYNWRGGNVAVVVTNEYHSGPRHGPLMPLTLPRNTWSLGIDSQQPTVLQITIG